MTNEENEWELCNSVEDVESLVSDCFPNHLPETNPYPPGDLHDAYECAVSNESESLYRQEERIAYEERQGPQHRPDYYGN